MQAMISYVAAGETLGRGARLRERPAGGTAHAVVRASPRCIGHGFSPTARDSSRTPPLEENWDATG